MKEQIKVGFCVAYDWYLLEYALPMVYNYADLICLSMDKDRISWSGHAYTFEQDRFDEMIERLDLRKKIIIHEDNFHLPELTSPENEVRQRNSMAKIMGEGGWHVQLDCDEYFLDFSSFVVFLKNLPNDRKAFNVCCVLVTLFKATSDGFLYIDPIQHRNLEFIQIATRSPQYVHGRKNAHFNIHTNYKIIHQSWARSSVEIAMKIENWGHNKDFDTKAYFQRWTSLNHLNYREMEDFHPVKSAVWPALRYIPATSVRSFINLFPTTHFPNLTKLQLLQKNSRLFAYARKALTVVGIVK